MNAMMNYPVVAGPVLIKGNRATCMLPNRAVDIVCPGEVLHKLTRRCDGRTPYAEIVADLKKNWDAGDLDEFVSHLRQEGVLVDANAIHARLWDFVKLPRRVGAEASAETIQTLTAQARDEMSHARPGMNYHQPTETLFGQLLQKRASTRWFGQKEVPLTTIVNMLWAAYGEGAGSHRTVPSAGALYPLQIDFIHLRDSKDLPQGIYRTHFLQGGKVGIHHIAPLPPQWLRVWFDPSIPREAQGIFVISGNMPRTATKYGNRAALLVPLEAGHVAQNIQLAAMEANLASVEFGGFTEEALSKLLRHPPEVTPLLTILWGSRTNDAEVELASKAKSLELRWSREARIDYELPFHVSSARVAGESGEWCWGRDTDPAMACVKSSAEALERHACAHPQGLYTARFVDLPHAIDPRQIVAYASSQYAREDFPFASFDLKREYLWKEGVDYASGESIAMLADLVYWGHEGTSNNHRPYTTTNTSGVAAYPTYQGALERAVLELIERDAFMRVWYSQISTPTIQNTSLSQSIQKRLRALAEIGVNVLMKDFTQELAPVVCVFAQSPTQHFTRVAAACRFESADAVDQALAEVETAVALHDATDKPKLIRPEEVLTPQDHGELYVQRRYFRRADFLAAGGTSVALSQVGARVPRDWVALTDRLAAQDSPIWHFDLGFPGAALHQGREPLAIVRAIIPGLLPIHFGYRIEPLATVQTALAAQRTLRPGADSHFPHPFP